MCRKAEPRSRGHNRGRLISLLTPEFEDESLGYLEKKEIWEKQVTDYEKLSKRKVDEEERIAVLQTKIAPDGIREHLLMNSSRLDSYEKVENEIDEWLIAHGGNSNTQMQVGAVDWNKGGKKGKGKDGGKPFQGYCSKCYNWGHKAANCWTQPKGGKGWWNNGWGDGGKGKGKKDGGKGKDGGNGKGKWRSPGQWGPGKGKGWWNQPQQHQQQNQYRDDRQRRDRDRQGRDGNGPAPMDVGAVEKKGGDQSNKNQTGDGVHMVQSGYARPVQAGEWIMMVESTSDTSDDDAGTILAVTTEKKKRPAMDSGCVTHVCPLNHGSAPVDTSAKASLKTATNEKINHIGHRRVESKVVTNTGSEARLSIF